MTTFWLRIVTERVIIVLSRLSSQERQLSFLQDLQFFVYKLQREIKLNGRLLGPNERIQKD